VTLNKLAVLTLFAGFGVGDLQAQPKSADEQIVRSRDDHERLAALHASVSRSQLEASDAEQIREIERQRLRSLVDVDLNTARRLHSDDFQLINPAGIPLTKEEYLGVIETGRVDYVAWEPGQIHVKLNGDLAVIRYKDIRFDVNSEGRVVHRGPMYHTNVYERRGGQWIAVWSQASGVITPR
jgi:hypothetical protein